MVACNVQLFGYGDQSEEIRGKINEILHRDGNDCGSIVTTINSSVKCAEHPDKDEPYLRLYSDDAKGGMLVAEQLCTELKQVVEFIVLNVVFLTA